MIRKYLVIALAAGSLCALGACENPDQEAELAIESGAPYSGVVGAAVMPRVTEYVVDGAQMSPGYVAVGDLNQDGRKEIVVTTLREVVGPPVGGPPPMMGAVHIYSRASKTTPMDQWSETVPFGTDKGFGFINLPQIKDFDGDGVKDIALNMGFLATRFGSQQYLKGPEFTTSVPFTAETAMTPYFYHELATTDLDKDGQMDIVTTRAQFVPPMGGPPSINLALDWYKGDGVGGYTRYTIDSASCGSVIKLYDVDKDGDKDIVCPQFFGPPRTPSIVWFEQIAKPEEANAMQGTWAKHSIDSTTGLGFDLRFVDIDGDKKDELVYSNHNHQGNPALVDANGAPIPSGIYYFEIPAKQDVLTATQWQKVVVDEGYLVTAPGAPNTQGTPGLIDIADINFDRRLDIITSGDGADGLFVLLQNKDKSFTRVELEGGNMWGQAVAADIDNCGKPEVVAVQHGYPINGVLPPGQVKIFKFHRK
ncbi:MAG: VCBS repeat-containing protein [Myxococcota bacterium]|jgi:hypothetical protein|nr:VCBS repeat-containing protein [Myxococcota bacterium]